MIRPLRKYHRIVWIILAFLLPAGFIIAFILSRKFEKFYNKELTIQTVQNEAEKNSENKIVIISYECVI